MSDPLGAKIAEKHDEASDPRKATPERARRPVAPGSLGFAAAASAACLVASLGLGLGTIHVPRLFEDPPPTADTRAAGSASTGTTSWSGTTTGTPTTARGGTPAGYFRYTGPAGLVTVLPDSFAVLSTGGSGTVTAKDQADPDVEVRFGGAAPESYRDLHGAISEAADATASRLDGYRQFTLERSWHGGLDAVEWLFEHETPQGETRWTRAHYWRTGGIEYVLLVQASPGRWSEAEQLLGTMIDHSDTP